MAIALKKLPHIVLLCVVIAAIYGFFFLATHFGTGENVRSEEPIVICQPQEAPLEQQRCVWTAHRHFLLHVFEGTKEWPLPFEHGDLQGMHTHAEKQKMHWHGLIPVDPLTKKVLDWSPLHVSKIVDDMELSTESAPQYIVNGLLVPASTVLQDGDTIDIRYE